MQLAVTIPDPFGRIGDIARDRADFQIKGYSWRPTLMPHSACVLMLADS
jgi:hypothetical protein